MQLVKLLSIMAILMAEIINANAQTDTSGNFFQFRLSDGPDTIYYPFYSGVQMIEIDNIGHWESKVNYYEMTQPRAMEWSMLIPEPGPNVYLFRDTTGRIVKAFNTGVSTQELTELFSKIPIDKGKNHLLYSQLFPGHSGKEALYSRGLIRSFKKSYWFNGYYKIYSSDSRFVGLIDSTGNIVLQPVHDMIMPVNEFLLVSKNGVCGIISKQMDTLLPVEYDNCSYESVDYILFSSNTKISKIYNRKKGTLYSINDYDEIGFEGLFQLEYNPGSSKTQAGLTYFRKDFKTGLIDTGFNEIVPAIYDYCTPYFTDGLTRVNKNKKWGYINNTGKEVIPCKYDDAEDFKKGVAIVLLKGKYQCIDTNGAVVNCDRKPEKWEEKRYEQGVVSGQSIVRKHGYGVINSAGQVVVPFIYQDISGFYENSKSLQYCYKVRMNHKYGVIDTSGNVLLPCAYDEITEFRHGTGLARVKKNNKWGIINKKMKEIVPCLYEGIDIVTNWGDNYIYFMQDRKMGIMDTLGQVFIPAGVYDEISWFNKGRARARKGDLYGFIDSLGNEIIPIRYEGLEQLFKNGLVAFSKNDKWGVIDSAGNTVAPAIYDWVMGFENVIAGAQKGDKWGFINMQGKEVTPFIYDNIGYSWRNGLIEVKRDRKTLFLNSEGKEVEK